MESSSETDRRIRQMVQFIRQEARDKAEEIEVRAKEECNVEVMKMTDKEKTKMRTEFAQKLKRVEIENKINRQKLLDTYRMELLKAEDMKKGELKDMCMKRFAKVTSNKGSYKAFLKQSMIQAFLLIWDEAEVSVSCRSEDSSMVQSLMSEALKEAKDKAEAASGNPFEMKATFNSKPYKCSGGVVVTARGANIICDNTLDARLNIVLQQQLPMVRSRLFGKGRLTSDA